jgi:hypothetical protein
MGGSAAEAQHIAAQRSVSLCCCSLSLDSDATLPAETDFNE